MKINCIAVDDEPLALEIIREYCSKIPFLNLIKTFDNAIETIDYLQNNKVNLLFLDIMMEDLTGIQLLSSLKIKPYVIFTTAYDNYAIQGFELDVIDYMLKPISFERFLKGVNKVSERIILENSHLNKGENFYEADGKSDSYFFVKTENRIEKVNFSEVLYFEGMGDYWRIIVNNRKIMSLLNAKKIEEMLPESHFCRVHKSFFVAYDKIESIERNRIKIRDVIIPIGETYRKMFFEAIDRRKIF